MLWKITILISKSEIPWDFQLEILSIEIKKNRAKKTYKIYPYFSAMFICICHFSSLPFLFVKKKIIKFFFSLLIHYPACVIIRNCESCKRTTLFHLYTNKCYHMVESYWLHMQAWMVRLTVKAAKHFTKKLKNEANLIFFK